MKVSLFIISLFFAISQTSCAQSLQPAKYFQLGLYNLERKHYALSIDGSEFFFIQDNWLKKVHLLHMTRDSVSLPPKSNYCYNIVVRSGGFSILSFSKSTQYKIDAIKDITLTDYNDDLIVIHTTIFQTITPSRLLEEDFCFTSLFHDTLQNEYFFNSEYGRMTKVEGNIWKFKERETACVDIETGQIYEMKHENSKNALYENEKRKFDLKEENIIRQFSVLSGCVTYYSGRKVHYFKAKDPSIIHTIPLTLNYSPGFRWAGGLYSLLNGQLCLLQLL